MKRMGNLSFSFTSGYFFSRFFAMLESDRP